MKKRKKKYWKDLADRLMQTNAGQEAKIMELKGEISQYRSNGYQISVENEKLKSKIGDLEELVASYRSTVLQYMRLNRTLKGRMTRLRNKLNYDKK